MPRRCGLCRGEGHDARNCPNKDNDEAKDLLRSWLTRYVHKWRSMVLAPNLSPSNIVDRCARTRVDMVDKLLEQTKETLITIVGVGSDVPYLTMKTKWVLAQEAKNKLVKISKHVLRRAYPREYTMYEETTLYGVRPTIQGVLKPYVETTEVFECAICIDEQNINNAAEFQCKHKFCVTCVDNMSKTAKRNSRELCCAMCRAKVTSLQVCDFGTNKQIVGAFCSFDANRGNSAATQRQPQPQAQLPVPPPQPAPRQVPPAPRQVPPPHNVDRLQHHPELDPHMQEAMLNYYNTLVA